MLLVVWTELRSTCLKNHSSCHETEYPYNLYYIKIPVIKYLLMNTWQGFNSVELKEYSIKVCIISQKVTKPFSHLSV